jgi:hypothetical protein
MVDPFFTANGSCYGCHTVSRDGQTMMAAFSTGSPFPQQTIDLTQNPAQYGTITMAQGLGGTFSAFNDKGDRIIISNDAAGNQATDSLRIIDANNGSILNANAMGNGCGEPAWSPDGKTLGAICGLNSFYLRRADRRLTLADGPRTASPSGTSARAHVGAGSSCTPDVRRARVHRLRSVVTGSRSTGNGQLCLSERTA